MDVALHAALVAVRPDVLGPSIPHQNVPGLGPESFEIDKLGEQRALVAGCRTAGDFQPFLAVERVPQAVGKERGIVGHAGFQADLLDRRRLLVFLREQDLDDGRFVRKDLDLEDILARIPAVRAVGEHDLVARAFREGHREEETGGLRRVRQ